MYVERNAAVVEGQRHSILSGNLTMTGDFAGTANHQLGNHELGITGCRCNDLLGTASQSRRSRSVLVEWRRRGSLPRDLLRSKDDRRV